MADSCAQYVNADDLKAVKESILHIEHVATSKDANGNPALVVTDPIRGVGYTNATLDGLFSDIGFKPVNGSFEGGGALVNRWDVLLYETNGSYYQWAGSLPKTVTPGSSPFDSSGQLIAGWVDRTDLTLRHLLNGADGLKLIGKCESVAQLRTIIAEENGQLITLDSYRAGSNKGGGIFQWNATSTAVDDSGVVIAVTGVATGRWIRQVNGRYTPEMYGADGTKTNDPSAVKSLLQHQKYVLFSGVYYMNDEFVTNGHNIEGGSTGEYYGNGSKTKIVFFGGFSAKQAVRNEITKSSYKNITFEPESWDPVDGYTGTGLRVGRTLDAENCNWFKFKEFGMDLWASITTELVHYPYGSQFRNCRFEFNGYAGIRFTNGANSVQIYGGTASWNGSTAYGVAPVDATSGWDGIVIGNTNEAGIPPMDNEFDLQGNIIEGIDCSYNARFGFHAYYANQSIFNIGYSEANFGTVSSTTADVNITDVVACDINILVAQRGANIAVPEKGFGVARSCANYPNRIVINGQFYGSGSKDSFDRYINYQTGKFANNVLAVGTAGNSGIRAWQDNDGSFETFSSGGNGVLIRANAGPLPAASAKYEGTLWRDTSVGPNGVYMCVTNGPGVYQWSKLN